MACGEFAEPIYKLIEELGDTDEAREKVLDSLVRFLRGQTIEDFVESFRQDYNMNDDETEDMETNEYVLCFTCQDTYLEGSSCTTCDSEETQPPVGSSRYFSSQIPEC